MTRKQCKAETRPYGPDVRNALPTKPLSGCTVERVMRVVREALADGEQRELSQVVASRTGLSERTIDAAVAIHAMGLEAELATVRSVMRGALDEAHRAYWDVVKEGAA